MHRLIRLTGQDKPCTIEQELTVHGTCGTITHQLSRPAQPFNKEEDNDVTKTTR
jgi:hypothetical protein